jgi:hypothetical protein
MAGVNGNDVGDIELVDGALMHREYLDALSTVSRDTRALLAALTYIGTEIVIVTGGAAVNANGTQWERLRVRHLIVTSITAGLRVFTIGTRSFSFPLAANTTLVLPFPLVIERGSDLSYSGDGTCYIVGDPE